MILHGLGIHILAAGPSGFPENRRFASALEARYPTRMPRRLVTGIAIVGSMWTLGLARADTNLSAAGCDNFFALGLALRYHLNDCNLPMSTQPHFDVAPPDPGDRCHEPGVGPMTPNACAAEVFHTPPEPGAASSLPLEWAYLSACASGDPTAVCPGEEVYCLDGTRPGFYIDWATDSNGEGEIFSHDWVFYFSGGGSCISGDECLADFLGNVGDTSTCNPFACPFADPDGDMTNEGQATVASRISESGLVSPSPFNRFHDFNRVFMNKCANDGYLGTTTRLNVSTAQGTIGSIPQHGNLILKRAFAQLANAASFPGHPTLDAADTIVLVGNSGGGRGLALTGDDHRAHLDSGILTGGLGRVRLVIDAQFLPSLEQENALWLGDPDLYVPDHWTASPPGAQLPPDQTGTASLAYGPSVFSVGMPHDQIVTTQPPLDASCLAAHPDLPATPSIDESHACRDEMHVQLHHLTTPTFIKMDIDDSVKRAAAPNHAHDPSYQWFYTNFHERIRKQFAAWLDSFALHSELALGADSSPAIATDNARKPANQDLAAYGPFAGGANSHTGLLDSRHFGLDSDPDPVRLEACLLLTGARGSADPLSGWFAGPGVTAMSALHDWVTQDSPIDAVQGYVNTQHGYVWVMSDEACPASVPSWTPLGLGVLAMGLAALAAWRGSIERT